MVDCSRKWARIGIVGLASCGGDASPAQDETGSVSAGTTGSGPSATSSGENSSSTTAVADTSTSAAATTTGTGESSESSTTGGPPADPGCPECIVLADGLENGRGIAVDDTHVYFTDQSAGTVMRVSVGGGATDTLALNQAAPYDITLDAESAYWTNYAEAGSVQRIAKDGDAPELVDTNAQYPRAVALDATHVYWTGFQSDSGGLYRRSIALDAPAQTLLTGSAGFADLVIGPARVYVTSHDPTTGSGGFIEPPPENMLGAVLSVPLAGDPDETETIILASDVAQPWGIALLNDGSLFWATGDGGGPSDPHRIFKLAIGAPPEQDLTGEQTAPWGVAADDDWVYFTDHTDVKAVPAGGGDVVVLATLQNSARSIAVSDDAVYWITQTRVLGRAKP